MNPRLACGQAVKGFSWLLDLNSALILFAERVFWLVDFPAFMAYDLQRRRLPQKDDELHSVVSDLVSEGRLPFAKTNFSMMNRRRGWSPYQELKGVVPSGRRILLWSKSHMAGGVVRSKAPEPIEQRLAELLRRPRLLLLVLRLILKKGFEAVSVFVRIDNGERQHNLNRATRIGKSAIRPLPLSLQLRGTILAVLRSFDTLKLIKATECATGAGKHSISGFVRDLNLNGFNEAQFRQFNENHITH
jgi:hypothetical protein